MTASSTANFRRRLNDISDGDIPFRTLIKNMPKGKFGWLRTYRMRYKEDGERWMMDLVNDERRKIGKRDFTPFEFHHRFLFGGLTSENTKVAKLAFWVAVYFPLPEHE